MLEFLTDPYTSFLFSIASIVTMGSLSCVVLRRVIAMRRGVQGIKSGAIIPAINLIFAASAISPAIIISPYLFAISLFFDLVGLAWFRPRPGVPSFIIGALLLLYVFIWFSQLIGSIIFFESRKEYLAKNQSSNGGGSGL
ncbi:MAG: hypothetical protein WC246_01085 [Candidatus Paceibacterota bacterium]|jgi:hypothetical protein